MRILLIGGTGFMGPFVARRLVEQGHQVAVFHRGRSRAQLPRGVEEIIGDRGALPDFRAFAPNIAIDFILASEKQARRTMAALRGMAGRVVALSSGDVYAASPEPLTEDSALRTAKPYPPEAIAALKTKVHWLDDEYDKIPVERVILGDPALPGTVLRLPMVYGPGDSSHRLLPHLRQMDEGSATIEILEHVARWRAPRGYVENVADAIVLAALSPKAAGRIYNVADREELSEVEWIQRMGRIAGWNGSVVTTPSEPMPLPGIMNSDRIRAELGYKEPIDLDEALRRTIAWERDLGRAASR